MSDRTDIERVLADGAPLRGIRREGPLAPVRGARSDFDADDFERRLEAFVAAMPEQAAVAYARAADKLRQEAEKNPLRRVRYALRAEKLARIARQVEESAIAVAADEADEEEETVDEAAEVLGSSRETLGVVEAIGRERAKQVVPVRITPSSANEIETVFGTQALVQYGGTSGSGSFSATTGGNLGPLVAMQEAPIIRWEGKEVEAQTVTVMIYPVQGGAGATYPNSGAQVPFYNYRPFAHVFWGGAYGYTFDAKVDVGVGCQFTLACNRLYVNVGMEQPPSSQVPGSMVVAGSFGFFSAARFSPVYRTRYVDSLAAGVGNRTTIPIPVLATTFEALIAATPTNWTLDVVDVGGVTLFSIDTSLAQTRANARALPNNAYGIRVTNVSGGGGVDSCQLLFGIAL